MSKQILILFLALSAITLSSCEDTVLSNLSESSYCKESQLTISQEKNDIGKEDYYWFHGKKIFLKEKEGKKFLLFDTSTTDFIKSASCQKIKAGLQKVSFPGMVYMNSQKQNIERTKWLIVNESKLRGIQQDNYKGVVYVSNFYEPVSGVGEFGVSHLFYVKLKSTSDVTKLLELAKKNKVNVVGYNKKLPLWYTLSCNKESNGDALQMANLFYETGLFEASEPDFMEDRLSSSKASYSNDQYYGSQWNLHGQYSINWEGAYALSQGKNVSIAIVDTGIEQLHPDFNFGYGLRGFDTTIQDYDSGNKVYDGHGTCCAGIIKATVGNGIGIAGIAPQATIYSVCNPFGEEPNVPQQLAMGLIAASDCDVISCSWGSRSRNSIIEDALQSYCFMWGRNGKECIVVFATGNANSSISFPANCDDRILTVGGSNSSGHRHSTSNYGELLDVVAPGTEIPTTDLLGRYGSDNKGDYYMNFGGTSAACPHVAAIAALILSVNPNLTRAEVNSIIQSTARKVGGYNYTNTSGKTDGTWNREMGYGLVDAHAAVLKAKQKL